MNFPILITGKDPERHVRRRVHFASREVLAPLRNAQANKDKSKIWQNGKVFVKQAKMASQIA
jgi:hypothetical protein